MKKIVQKFFSRLLRLVLYALACIAVSLLIYAFDKMWWLILATHVPLLLLYIYTSIYKKGILNQISGYSLLICVIAGAISNFLICTLTIMGTLFLLVTYSTRKAFVRIE